MCHHRERQEEILEMLRTHGGQMDLMKLIGNLTRGYGYAEGEAVMALLDSPPRELDVNYATGKVSLRDLVSANSARN